MRKKIVDIKSGYTLQDVDFYRFFSYMLGHPSQDRFDWLNHSLPEETLKAYQPARKSKGRIGRRIRFDSFEQYEATYIALFDVGVPSPPVPLLESYYHKAIPAQQTVLENADFYGVLELRPADSVTAPDHLITQLEFLASIRYLQANCNDESERINLCRLELDFLERHVMSWIPSAFLKLREVNPPIFPTLFALLLQFLHCRRSEVV